MALHIYQSVDNGTAYIPPTAGGKDGELVAELSNGSPRILLSQLRNLWTSPIKLALRSSEYDDYLVHLYVQGDHADLIQISYDGINWISGQLTIYDNGKGTYYTTGGLWFSWIQNTNTIFWIKGYIDNYFGDNFDNACVLYAAYEGRI